MSNTDNQAETQTPNALTAAEQRKRELVNFVANNILNSLTMNQTINVVQQVALRDANQIVSEADETKLQEIETAYTNALQAAQGAAQGAEQSAPEAKKPAKAKAKAPAAKKRASAKKSASA